MKCSIISGIQFLRTYFRQLSVTLSFHYASTSLRSSFLVLRVIILHYQRKRLSATRGTEQRTDDTQPGSNRTPQNNKRIIIVYARACRCRRRMNSVRRSSSSSCARRALSGRLLAAALPSRRQLCYVNAPSSVYREILMGTVVMQPQRP